MIDKWNQYTGIIDEERSSNPFRLKRSSPKHINDQNDRYNHGDVVNSKILCAGKIEKNIEQNKTS